MYYSLDLCYLDDVSPLQLCTIANNEKCILRISLVLEELLEQRICLFKSLLGSVRILSEKILPI
jgi:hypothetical protein